MNRRSFFAFIAAAFGKPCRVAAVKAASAPAPTGLAYFTHPFRLAQRIDFFSPTCFDSSGFLTRDMAERAVKILRADRDYPGGATIG